MKEYKPLSISNFRTGFDESVEPWLLPRDAYQILKNAHLYRGVLEKINGYDLYARMSYRETIQLSGTIDGVNQTFTGTLNHAPSTNNFFGYAATNSLATTRELFTYDSDGTYPDINLLSGSGGTGTLDLNTLIVTLNFNTPPAQVPGGGNLYNAVTFTYDYLASDVLSPSDDQDIMGIKQYYAITGAEEIIIFDTNRAGKIVTLTSPFISTVQATDNGISEIPHESHTQSYAPTPPFDGVATVFTGTASAPIVPGTVSFILYSATAVVKCNIVDNGSGALIGTGSVTATGFINYFTGDWTVTFSAAPVVGDTLNISTCVYGNTFSGNYTNFFSVVNYTFKMFITNNVDNIMYYDGVCIRYLPANIFSAINVLSYDINTCLHVYVDRERLLLFYPRISNIGQPNLIQWSEAGNPLNFTNNERLPAPTSEAIRTFSKINTDVIVRFANSERIFRYTGDSFSPFRWDSTNSVWRTDSRYSCINYDDYFTAVGKPAIVGSDGVNMKRADEIIPDFTLNDRALIEGPIISIDQTSMGQCYGERFDDFKEGWLCFRAYDENNPNPDVATIDRSDSVLAFNYLDHTYAVYTFPLNVLGFGRVTSVDTWGNNFDKWSEANYAWASFYESPDALVDLAGDRFGKVHTLGNGNTRLTVDGETIPVLFDVITKNFNPFIEDGELCRLGFVDLFVSSNAETKLRVQFYRDDTMTVGVDGNPTGAYQETVLTFIPTDNMSPLTPQKKVWKRVYVGAVAREHTIRFYQAEEDFNINLNQPVRIHAIVLWMKPAGRLFN